MADNYLDYMAYGDPSSSSSSSGGSFLSSLGLNSTTASAGVGGLGLGISLFGTAESLQYGQQLAGIQAQEYGISENMAKSQMAVNALQAQQMNLNTQRQQMQNLRNLQRARSQGLTSATSSGAQFGSGLKGAYGSQSGQSGFNTLGSSQNLQIGQGINQQINIQDQYKMIMAQLQSQAATAQGNMGLFGGIGSAGSSLLGGALSIGKLLAMA